MDPLSVAASVASLIGITEVTARRLHKYASRVKGAGQEIGALTKEITGLYALLNGLHLKADLLGSEASKLSRREQSMCIEHVHACYSTMDSIDTLLKKDGPSTAASRAGSVIRRLHWPSSKSKTISLIGEIERHKQTLALAADADTLEALLQSLS